MRRIQQRPLIQHRQPSLLNSRIHDFNTTRRIVLPSNIQNRNINLVSTLRKLFIARVLVLDKSAVPALRRVEPVTTHPVDKILAELCVLSIRTELWVWIAVIIGEVLTKSIWDAEEALGCVACAVEARIETLNVVREDLTTIWVGEKVPNRIRISSCLGQTRRICLPVMQGSVAKSLLGHLVPFCDIERLTT